MRSQSREIPTNSSCKHPLFLDCFLSHLCTVTFDADGTDLTILGLSLIQLQSHRGDTVAGEEGTLQVSPRAGCTLYKTPL